MKKSLLAALVLIGLLCLHACIGYAEQNAEVFVLPDDIIVIDEEAFLNAVSAAHVIIPDGAQTIGARAFAGSDMCRLDIPATVTAIGADAFAGSSVQEIYFGGTKIAWEAFSAVVPEGAVVMCSDGMVGEQAGGEWGSNLRWSVSGDMLTFYGIGAMQDQSEDWDFPWYDWYCKKLVVADGVTSIGSNMFRMGTIEMAVLGKDVKHIGECAFGESSLREIVLPEGLETIGAAAFGTTELTELNVPASVTLIDGDPFWDNFDVTAVNVHPDNAVYCSVDGILYTKDMTELVYYPVANGSNYVMPDTVTRIGHHAAPYSDINSIVFSKNLIEIGENAFVNCFLEEVDLSGTQLKKVGEGAFHFYPTVTILLPASVEEIGDWAFDGDSVTVIYDGTEEDWNRIRMTDAAFSTGMVIRFSDGTEIIAPGMPYEDEEYED